MFTVFAATTPGLELFGEDSAPAIVPARPFLSGVIARRSDADALGRTVCLVDGRWVDARQVRGAARAWDRAAENRGHVVPGTSAEMSALAESARRVLNAIGQLWGENRATPDAGPVRVIPASRDRFGHQRAITA